MGMLDFVGKLYWKPAASVLVCSPWSENLKKIIIIKIRSQIIQMVVQSAASAMVGESSNTELLLSNSFIEAGRWGDKRVPGRVQAGGPQLGGADAVAGCSAAVGGRGGARGGRVRPPQPFLQRGPHGL